MSTKVVHVNSPEFRDNPEAVYIGRKVRRASDPRCNEESPWANPFQLQAEDERRVVIELFERHLRSRLVGQFGDGWKRDLLALDGKVLGCWCHPKPCHGDVLVKLIEELKAERPRDGK